MNSGKKDPKEKDLNRNVWLVELAKWLIGTVGLGVTGFFINYNIQNTDLKIKRMEADTKLLEVVSKDLAIKSTSDSIELRYLSFIKTFITTLELSEAVNERIAELIKQIKIEADYNFKIDIENKRDKAIDKISEEKKKELSEKEAELTNGGNEVNIDELSKLENNIVTDIISIDSSTISNLNAIQKSITSTTINDGNENYSLVGDPIIKWCKKGYYVDFHNSIRIGIDELTNQSIVFNIKDIQDKNEVSILEKNHTLSIGESFFLTIKDYRYQISLNYIGAAGKNPFTKAAYITILKYKEVT